MKTKIQFIIILTVMILSTVSWATSKVNKSWDFTHKINAARIDEKKSLEDLQKVYEKQPEKEPETQEVADFYDS